MGKKAMRKEKSVKNNVTDEKTFKRKAHVCYFCGKKVQRIYDHFTRVHKNEEEVKIIQHTEDREARFWKWKVLTQKGDFKHNREIRETTGSKIIVKAPTLPSPKKTYFDCPYCLGRLRLCSRARHFKICKAKINQKEQVLKELQDIFHGMPEYIINKIRQSELLALFLKYTMEEKGKEDRSTMRTLAGDLIQLEDVLQEKNRTKPLVKFFCPENVDNVIESIKKICEETRVGKDFIFRYPSKAQKLCRVVVQLSKFLELHYGKKTFDLEASTVSKFLNLFTIDSENRIKKQAYRSIKLSQLKSPKKLPKTSAITKLITKLKEDMLCLLKRVREEKDEGDWRALAEIVLARLTIFNRRRGGAVEKMTVQNYLASKEKQSTLTEEATFDLDKEETEFLENVKIVEIIHKCDNIVPIFVNKELEEAMDVLLELRSCVQIHPDNPHFFPAGKNSLNAIRGVRVLEKFREFLPEEERRLLTATNLRKHGATTAQVLNLNQQDQEEWAIHMGHSVDVHKRYYRYKENVNAILKTGRILTALDQGTLKHYKGKTIKDIPLNTSEDSKK